MGKAKSLHINWSDPKPIDDIIEDLSDEIGLYYITRLYNGVETSLYIGKSENATKSRLRSHRRDWTYHYTHSKILVRIGTITYPKLISDDMINDAESALIFEHGCGIYGTKVLVENTDKIHSYNYNDLYRIKNYGNRFQLKPIVDMSCHPDCES